MESLENKRKSNKNLIGHSKEKKQDLSVRTEEKIKTEYGKKLVLLHN